MYTKIYDIAYEIDGDQLNLEQENGCGEASLLTLHRWQLAPLAELMGIVKAAPDGESQKTIATLTRRLIVLRDRIDYLADYLANNSDSLSSTTKTCVRPDCRSMRKRLRSIGRLIPRVCVRPCSNSG